MYDSQSQLLHTTQHQVCSTDIQLPML